MAVIQSKQSELRYLRRKNLNEESRVIGGWYRDCIRQFGIDCIYHKLNTTDFHDFKNIIDQNAILKRAYGYNITPSYEISANMIVFAEIDQDIFQLNKYGIQPQTDINLYFDSVQFACDMAPKIGRYKEYRIKETDVVCEVPECTDEITSYVDPVTHETVSGYISSDIWPYELGLGYAENYSCEILQGRLRCVLSGYELGKQQTVMCDPYEHTDFNIRFPQNDDLYYSLKYKIENDDYLETMLFLTYKVEKIRIGENKFKCVLTGKLHGSVLFFDLYELRKYTELIHPMVGDVIEIDFPDENNREKYEITDCFDKQLAQDGINPLLHKYIWKCKARRHITGDECENLQQTEADLRLEEQHKYQTTVNEQVADAISMYDTLDESRGLKEDAVYGGYEGVTVPDYDKQLPHKVHEKYEMVEGCEAIDIIRFECGSRLVTNGYDLIFVTLAGNAYIVAPADHQPIINGAVFESGLRWLKATDSQIVFVNIEGQSSVLANDDTVNDRQLEICINSLYDSTVDTAKLNKNGDNFIKFGASRTIIWATENCLFAKLQSDGSLRQLI